MPVLSSHIPKKATFEVLIPDVLPEVEGDPGQIVQAVTNIVINAAESLKDETGTVRLKAYATRLSKQDLLASHCVAAEEATPGQYLCIMCEDTGEGMAEDTLNRIFEPFYSTRFFGRGLGLTAVLGIMKGHKGAVSVESRKGHGTRIRLYFPASSSQKFVG